MYNTKFKLNLLAESNLDCVDHNIHLGGTLTLEWGNVLKLISVNSSAKEAVVEHLYYGDSIELRLMKYNDIFSFTNPSDPEVKRDVLLKSVFAGKEINIATFNSCTYTKQYSTLIMITDLPASVVDGQSYTVSGRLTKDKLNETLETPIVNEKVYITESGTNVSETTTDSDGVFSLTFTYHSGFIYNILYSGTVDVTKSEHLLVTHTSVGSTHLLKYIFPTPIPDVMATAFKYVNPSDLIVKTTQIIEEQYPGFGWTIDEINMSNTQIHIYVTQTSAQLSTYSVYNVSTGTIQKLVIDEIAITIFAIGVFGLALFALGIVGLGIGALAAAGVIIGFLWMARREIWKLISGIASELLKDLGQSDSTTGEVNENAKEFLNVKLKECADVYNSSAKDASACIVYAECMRDAYSNFQEYTQGYLFQKVSTSLTLNSKKLKSEIDTKCINKFKAGEISCVDLISCTINEGNNSISGGDSIIYNEYPKDDPYIAPWEEDNNGGLFGNLLLYGGLALVGYIGYKAITSSNK